MKERGTGDTYRTMSFEDWIQSQEDMSSDEDCVIKYLTDTE